MTCGMTPCGPCPGPPAMSAYCRRAPNIKLTDRLQIRNAFHAKRGLWQDTSIQPDAPNMKILIVEDEPKTGNYLKQGLTEAGFVTDLARDGWEGLELAQINRYDLMILDVMLPGLDGWQVLEGVRRAGIEMPVLFLTARDQVEDRVKGLELGADDYLVKPFAFSELLARVRSLVRRGHSSLESTVLKAADLELDLLRRRAVRAGNKIELTAKEFALLELFLRRQGEVLPRSLIASQVWDMNFDSDTNVIDVAVRRLRIKIDEGFEHKLIHTVRGMGYVLELPAEGTAA